MKLLTASLLLLTSFALTAHAHADTIDNFVLTYKTDTYSFSLPSPLSVPRDFYQQFYTTALVNKNGVTELSQINFYSGSVRGGLQLSGIYATGYPLYTIDPTATYPVFSLGTFPLLVYPEGPASITITEETTPPSTVPEPSSLALLATGVLGIGATLRRKLA